jgi:DNA-binding transcriptional regulator GbsR (MarR family)
MIYGSLLGEKRWEILESISLSPASPTVIAEKIGTTVSYVSQQLKLLEVAGLVKKTKTGFSEKGRPRNIYHLSEEFIHISSLENGFAFKKNIKVNFHRKALLNIWTLNDESIQESVEILYSKLKTDIKDIHGIFATQGETTKVIIASDKTFVLDKVKSIIAKLPQKIQYLFISQKSLEKIDPENLVPIYDPSNILLKRRIEIINN